MGRESSQPAGDGRSHDPCDFELHIEQVLEPAVVALCPSLAACLAVHKVKGKAHALALPPDGPGKKVPHSERSANGGGIALLSRNAKGRVARHDKEILVARQLRDDVVCHSFGEIAAALVGADRAERQNGDRGAVRQNGPLATIRFGGR